MFMDSTIEDAVVKGYFGQNAVQSGYMGAKLMSYAVPKKSKILVLNLANKLAITRHLKNRQKGFLDFMNQAGRSDKLKTLCVDIDITAEREPEKSLARILVLKSQGLLKQNVLTFACVFCTIKL